MRAGELSRGGGSVSLQMAHGAHPGPCGRSPTPDDLRSRSSGAINYGIRPVGAVVGGLLGSTVGIRPTLAIAAVGMALSCFWLIASPIRTIRGMQELDGVDPYTGRNLAGI